jgi:putative salt-induced outer membrane protein
MRSIFFVILISCHSYCLAGSKLVTSDFSELAFDVAKVDIEEWELSTELGATMTTGNTDTQAIKGKIKGGLDYLNGRLTYLAQFYQKTVDEERSADKWKVGVKHNIYFTEHSSSFSILEYAQDTFASAQKKAILAAGYTQRLFDNNILLWNADIGPGIVWTDCDEGESNQRIIHLGSQFKLKLNEKTEFEQSIVADLDIKGRNKDVYRAETSLSASVVENFKMKLSYAMKFDANVDIDKERLDTETSVSVVYIF